MTRELWTVVVDAVVSVGIAAAGIWVAPEYLDFALTTVAALQAVASGMVVYFVQERKIEALRTEIQQVSQRLR